LNPVDDNCESLLGDRGGGGGFEPIDSVDSDALIDDSGGGGGGFADALIGDEGGV
jgi:hypothetical protein